MFLAVNIFFFHEYNTYSKSIGYYSEEEITAAVSVLEKNHTPVEKSAIPKEKLSLKVLKLEFEGEWREKVAKSLMDSDFAAFALPEGTGYRNSEESLIFHEGRAFTYSRSDAQSPAPDTLDKLAPSNEKEFKKILSRLEKKLLSADITDTHKLSLSIVGAYKSGSSVFIKAQQLIDGKIIDKNEIIASFEDDTLLWLEGNLFFSPSIYEFSSDTLDTVNVLFKTPKSDNTIIKIEELYYPVATESGSFYLTPSLMFTHKNKETHVWDSTSGIQRY